MAELDLYQILVAEHQDMLHAYVLGLIRDPALADDICQETFIQGFRHLAQLKKKEAFPAWLRTIARHAAWAEMRRRGREVATDPGILQGMEDVFAALDPNPDASTWAERARQVRDCFERLPDTLKTCCRLYYYDGRSVKEAAAALKTSLAAALKRLERARTAIGECMEERLRLEETR
jgi:RNA polymerase sigma-70 factor (ECF subfamily)